MLGPWTWGLLGICSDVLTSVREYRLAAPGPEGEQATGARDLKDLEQVQRCPPASSQP